MPKPFYTYKQFYFKQLRVKHNYQVLTLRVRANLGAMVMNGYSAFSKAPVLLEPHRQIV